MTLAPDALPARRRPLPRRAALLLVHALLALPVTVLALLLAVTGKASAAGRLQRRLASLGGLAASPAPAPDRFRTVVGRAFRGLPANVLAFALATPSVVLLLSRGLLYPLATAGEDPTHAWGGPTAAGAWAAHFAIALVMVTVVAALLVATRRPHRW
ncbi:hypothetical protein AB0L33_03855 [Streptomyces sp. NPDC052299]|uniref:hypothetical protein n=1 Tax=Streptomyces sp. NPDC052299 TaxID=3155054 RepID=UPI00341F9841